MAFGMLIGTLAQVIPTGYIVITGRAPAWARIIMGVWLCLWLLVLLCQSIARQVKR